jgi:hypothetical protein
MTYIRRKRNLTKKPKDQVLIALNNLASGSYVNGIWVGDQLLCTEHTFKNIEERLDAFKKERQDRRMAVVPRGVIRYIRRVA